MGGDAHIPGSCSSSRVKDEDVRLTASSDWSGNLSPEGGTTVGCGSKVDSEGY